MGEQNIQSNKLQEFIQISAQFIKDVSVILGVVVVILVTIWSFLWNTKIKDYLAKNLAPVIAEKLEPHFVKSSEIENQLKNAFKGNKELFNAIFMTKGSTLENLSAQMGQNNIDISMNAEDIEGLKRMPTIAIKAKVFDTIGFHGAKKQVLGNHLACFLSSVLEDKNIDSECSILLEENSWVLEITDGGCGVICLDVEGGRQ